MISRPLSLAEAAGRVGVKVGTVRDWIYRARAGLPLHDAGRSFAGIVERVGGRLVVDEHELRRWRAERRCTVRPAVSADREQVAAELHMLTGRVRAAGFDLAADALRLAERALEVTP